MCRAFVSLCCFDWGGGWGGWGEGGRDVNTFRKHKQIWKSTVDSCIYDFGSLTWKWCTSLYCHWIEFPVLSGQVVGMVSKITGWKQEWWWLHIDIHVASWPISSMQPRILNQWINLIAVWETHSFITLEFGNQKNPQNSEEPTLWVKHCSTKQDVHVHTVGTLDSCCLQCMNAVWSAHYYKTFAFRIVTMSSLLQKIDFLA